jgi:hypothetical protein
MKRYLLALAAVLLVGGYAELAQAVPCSTTGTFADLITQSTCTVDDKTFDGFSYLDLIGNVPSPALNYAVVNANGLEGFDFQFDLAPGALGFFTFNFTVSCAPGVDCIISNHLSLSTNAFNGFVIEQYFLNGDPSNGGFLNAAPGAQLDDASTFAPVHSILVTELVELACGDIACSTTLSNAVDQVQGAPEPATLALVLAGLFGAATSRRRKTN